jgi:hypothetical protein
VDRGSATPCYDHINFKILIVLIAFYEFIFLPQYV